ncbi:hypothetical protein C0Q70_12353 [Pomacea canaliculata]|uniref:Uncharacterized protein n=1 Tax=Pomacea canaliculata TaxID=400727 RepID=A0A2T7P1B2_POMCA|nr:hypothetical protein C0Q70_12353 [Pomacea canaliculata]
MTSDDTVPSPRNAGADWAGTPAGDDPTPKVLPFVTSFLLECNYWSQDKRSWWTEDGAQDSSDRVLPLNLPPSLRATAP